MDTDPLLTPSPATTPILGIDIGGSKIAISRYDGNFPPTEFTRFPTSTPEHLLDTLATFLPTDTPPRIGIACGGPLAAKTGTLLTPPNLPAWHHFPITQAITKRFGGSASLMNDANANALAEWKFGAGRECQSMIFLTAGTGMGAGIILNGRLWSGANGNAGEVGHVRLHSDGPLGYGKSGSFEGFCSGGTLPQIVHWLPAADRPADITAWAEAHPDPRSIIEAAHAGDSTAASVLRAFGRHLGQALAVLIDILNPERIVLGTIYQTAREFLEAPMRTELHREALPETASACEILPANLGPHLGNAGAICATLYENTHH